MIAAIREISPIEYTWIVSNILNALDEYRNVQQLLEFSELAEVSIESRGLAQNFQHVRIIAAHFNTFDDILCKQFIKIFLNGCKFSIFETVQLL